MVSVWDPVAGHPQLRRRLLNTQGKPGSVSCGVTAPFYWVLVCTRFSLCPPRVSDSPVLWKLWNQIPLAFKVKFPVGFSPFDGWEIFSVVKQTYLFVCLSIYPSIYLSVFLQKGSIFVF